MLHLNAQDGPSEAVSYAMFFFQTLTLIKSHEKDMFLLLNTSEDP